MEEPLRLHRPDFSKPFRLQTDASSIGISAVLFQLGPEGERQIVSYFSSTLSETERKYHINEAEVLAVVTGLKRYREYLADTRFTLLTDSKALTWLNQHKDNKSKLMRWALLLQEYSYDVEMVPGRENYLADFLSRYPEPQTHGDSLNPDRLLLPERRAEARPESETITVLNNDELYAKIVRAQATSRVIGREKTRWQDIRLNGPQNASETRFLEKYTVHRDILWKTGEYGDKLIVPQRYETRVISQYHDSTEIAHPGAEETAREVQRVYHFNNLRKKVTEYVRNCLICASVKSNKRQARAPLKPRTPRGPFETVSIDVLGPYDEQPSGNKYILMLTDIFTKWVEAKATPDGETKTICRFLEDEVIMRYGAPKTIISDNASVFDANEYIRFARKYDIELYKTPIYHQRANAVERRVQELKKVLRTRLYKSRDKTKWEQQLGPALRILRSRKNRATGETPAKALLGFEIPRAGDWNIPTYREERQQDQVTRRDRRRIIRRRQLNFNQTNYQANPVPPRVYQQGEMVMTREFRADRRWFHPKWTGPHPVTGVCSNEVYFVDRNGAEMRVHVDDVRPAPPGNAEPRDSSESDTNFSDSSRSDLSSSEEDPDSGDEGRPEPPDPTARAPSPGTGGGGTVNTPRPPAEEKDGHPKPPRPTPRAALSRSIGCSIPDPDANPREKLGNGSDPSPQVSPRAQGRAPQASTSRDRPSPQSLLPRAAEQDEREGPRMQSSEATNEPMKLSQEGGDRTSPQQHLPNTSPRGQVPTRWKRRSRLVIRE